MPRNGRPSAARRSEAVVAGVLLAPGAGSDADQPAFVELARAVAQAGVPVHRMDFPYRLAGRRRPDCPEVLEAAVRDAATTFAGSLGVPLDQLVLGGRSMGGRICSRVVAAGFPCAGLALVSYPLHPPGRPDVRRDAHFPHLGLPCLFVSGTRDVFGTRAELEGATSAIPGRVSHVWIEGGDHGLRRHVRDAGDAACEWLCSGFALCAPDER